MVIMARSGITLLEWCNNNGEFGEKLKQEWTGELETGGKIRGVLKQKQ